MTALVLPDRHVDAIVADIDVVITSLGDYQGLNTTVLPNGCTSTIQSDTCTRFYTLKCISCEHFQRVLSDCPESTRSTALPRDGT